jgi:hypothetical protein
MHIPGVSASLFESKSRKTRKRIVRQPMVTP